MEKSLYISNFKHEDVIRMSHVDKYLARYRILFQSINLRTVVIHD